MVRVRKTAEETENRTAGMVGGKPREGVTEGKAVDNFQVKGLINSAQYSQDVQKDKRPKLFLLDLVKFGSLMALAEEASGERNGGKGSLPQVEREVVWRNGERENHLRAAVRERG